MEDIIYCVNLLIDTPIKKPIHKVELCKPKWLLGLISFKIKVFAIMTSFGKEEVVPLRDSLPDLHR